jgi:hypothetical protein
VGSVPRAGDYWGTATAAEAQLIQQNYGPALTLYEAAIEAAPLDLGSLHSTFGQAQLLMQALDAPADIRESVRRLFAEVHAAD